VTQTAIVKKILDKETALVEVERKTACGGECSSCGGTCSFKNKLSVVASNGVCAAVGDSVVIESESVKIIGAAALVYLMPIIVFLFGYFIASALGMTETASIAVSVLSLAAGMIMTVVISRIKKKKTISFSIIGIE
jgi:Positive regulator of sigma E activity